MIPEGFDKSITTVIAISSSALALWAHRRELAKEKQRAFDAAKQKYSDAQLKEYAAQRDFGHIRRDLEQLKNNIAHLNQEADERLDRVERQVEKFSGALDVLMRLIEEKQKT